jgi:DNA-binding transcriptional ArsR family regulator
MTSLAEKLLGGSRTAVLATLMLRPDEAMHVRELARLTGVSAGTLHRELRALSELGLLVRRETGRQVFYSADRTSPIFEELAGVLRKTAGLADVLRSALGPIVDRLRVAFVYGSMAAGEAMPHSDVDVMVLGDATFADVARALHPAQAALGREINPTVMKPAEFARRRHTGDGFVVTVMRQPKIWLLGNNNDLAKLDQDRPVETSHRNTGGSATVARRRKAEPARRRAAGKQRRNAF